MIRKITQDQPLKILGFTDTHLDHNEGPYHLAMKLIRETIQSEKPDVVVFVGDNVTSGYNKERLAEFTQMMTDLKTPWCPVLGNHEADNPYSERRSEMVRVFRTSPYCLIPEEKAHLADGTPVHGEPNYAVSLLNEEGKVCHKLIFLDSGADMAEGDAKKYGPTGQSEDVDDYLKENQIAWYREQVRRDDCPSMVFSHIPLPEYRDACQQGEFLAGGKLEGIGAPRHNSGMFAAMKEEGKSVAFVAGHDHINDFRILHEGIYLIYNRMSGLSSYNVISKKLGKKLLQGASVYYIDVQGRLGFGDILYEDRFPFYHDDIYAVIRK